ncbi:class I SAM-dependent methyltransferase [Paenarthrobacter sp. NPDC089322]|uniref:class I SAM-dependent methyltransferase n=1 Tax=Paenarthrobacter sp. NPDC089322 TaxID=3155065 RepID=UPI0034192090
MNTTPDKTADAILRVLGHVDPPEDLYSVSGSRLYDLITANDLTELPEILAAARKTSGPILELASGSGRITRPLLSLGRSLTAVDSSPEMLALLKAKVATQAFNPGVWLSNSLRRTWPASSTTAGLVASFSVPVRSLSLIHSAGVSCSAECVTA